MKTASLLLAAVVAITSFAALSTTAEAVGGAGFKGPPGHRKPTPGTETTYTCANELGMLRRVYTEQIDGIFDESEVTVTPVCSGEDYGVMRNDGNAGALRQSIAMNDATAAALADANFRPEDVIAVRMTGDDSVILYVHTFLYR